MALFLPWRSFFSPFTPTGGDNPAHPYFIESLKTALLEHGSAIHYATGFWNGFELFQFYFPLPYAVGAILSTFLPMAYVYKVITLAGLFATPPAFYLLARFLGAPLGVRLLASLISVGFLYTQAHVMWGANIYSTIAGMIGNQWGFALFIAAFGWTLSLWRERDSRFRPGLVLLFSLIALCHFYGLLMLILLHFTLALIDCVSWIRDRTKPPVFLFYTHLAAAFGVIAAWFLPLLYYLPYSSEFGWAWDVTLLKTFTKAELIAALGASLVLVLTRWDRVRTAVFLFGVLALALFYGGGALGSVAFLNIRIWPTFYFASYVWVLLGAMALTPRLPKPLRVLPLALAIAYLPSQEAFTTAKNWLDWNWSGLETKRGWEDLKKITALLNQDHGSRVITELSGELDPLGGSSRTFELLPYLTQSEIPIGGLVNSATYAGASYSLQCLVGKGCAGFPARTMIPAFDPARAAALMRTFGVKYLIPVETETRDAYRKQKDFDEIHKGRHLSLFRLKTPVSRVEVYDSPLPIVCSDRGLTLQINLHRWDVLRDAGLIFRPHAECRDSALALDHRKLFNTLIEAWKPGAVTWDRGWETRTDRQKQRLIGFLFSYHEAFDRNSALGRLFEPYPGYRPFDTDLLVPNLLLGRSELALPLLRDPPGVTTLTLVGRGFEAFLLSQPQTALEWGKPLSLTISEDWLLFKPKRSERFHNVEIYSDDKHTRSLLPGGSLPTGVFPKKITSTCKTSLKTEFHRLTLNTSCPGKPHVLKYSYYPKWGPNVDPGPYGFMVVTPERDTLVLEHKPQTIDRLGLGISGLSLGFLCLIAVRRRRARVRG